MTENHGGQERHGRNVGMNTDMMSLAFDALELAREDSKRIVDDVIAAAAGVNDKLDENASRLERMSKEIPAALSRGIMETEKDLEAMLSKIDAAAAAHQRKIDAAADAHHLKFSSAAQNMLGEIQTIMDFKMREVAQTASAAATKQLQADLRVIAARYTSKGVSAGMALVISLVSAAISGIIVRVVM